MVQWKMAVDWSTCVTCTVSLLLAFNVHAVVAGAALSSCEQKDADVLILGAGLAGLGAARTLSTNGIDNFLIIEQDNEIGGRTKSRKFAGTTVELGAQWIVRAGNAFDPNQEPRHPFLDFADRCNITYRPSPFGSTGIKVYSRNGTDITSSPELQGALGRFENARNPAVVNATLDTLGDEDMPLGNGLRAGGWFPITPVEEWADFFGVDFAGFAESADHQSYKYIVNPEVINLRENTFGGRAVYVVTDDVGYVAIAQCIANDFMRENDPRLILETAVRSIEWSEECVCVNTNRNRRYCGTYAISTIPLGVIQNNGVQFVPNLPLNVHVALHKMTMGRFMRIYAAYNETFWDTDVDIIGHVDDINGRDHYAVFSPWGSFFPEGQKTNVIQALLYGDIAKRISYQDPEITRRQMGDALRNMYGSSVPDPLEITMSPFTSDPYFLGNLGGIPTPGMTNETFRFLNRPIGRLYFAGDFVAYHFHSTAHGAYLSGVDTGGRIARLMQLPPRVSFLNDSPRVVGNTISAEFIVSKEVDTLECILDRGQRQNCSSGRVEYTGLAEGPHVLKVIARNEPMSDRGVETRGLYISDSPHCAVHLINDGISVHEESAIIQFESTGLPVSSFECNMDGVRIFECSSPLELRRLSAGRHRVRIRPQCAGRRLQRSYSFFSA